MNIEIRIYKRYDTDLLSLHDAGYSITKMMEKAVSSYANGLPCHFFIDEMLPFDMNDKKSVRLRLKFKDNDYNTVNLIRNVKHGYRSNFCKQLLRNSFVQQNLLCYMANSSTFPMHDRNAKTFNLQAFPDLQMCSSYKRKTQKLHFLGKDIVVKHEKGYKYKPYQDTFSEQNQMVAAQMIQMQNLQEYQRQVALQNMQTVPRYDQMFMSGQYPAGTLQMPVGNLQSIQPQTQQMVSPSYMMPNMAIQQQPVDSNIANPPIGTGDKFQSHKTESLSAPSEEPSVGKEDTSEAPQLANNDNLMAMFDGL